MDIHHLYQDRNDKIWLATGDIGLLQLKMENGELKIQKQYTTQNGLSSNILHSVYEDDYEYLWISSNEGLMQFDKQTERIVTYTTESGLLHNEFNRISHFQAENGTLYFGGLTGVVNFHPKHFSKIRHDGHQTPLVITNFQQFSASKGLFQDLTKQLNQTQIIHLKPNDRFFKLNLALLDFKDNASYQYRIKNVYGWQTTKDSELNISGLPYGKHILEVKAFNANQNEAANTLSFTIYVLRPFYLQWWFIALVLIGLGTAIFFFIKWRTKQLFVFQETEQLRQLDKIKSQFFANISHELRTPITLILAPLSQFLKKDYLSKNDKKDLTKIYANSKNLLNLVNEVLDLSKLEANKLKLHETATKIPQFIERIIANFESAATAKDIQFHFMAFLEEDLVVLFDKDKLEKIFNNLLSNALKFTAKNGEIQVVVGKMGNKLVVKIKDNGKGIPQEDLPYIFDRYFQSKNKQLSGGTGIGLALTKELTELMKGEIRVASEKNKGTEFTVELPIQLIDGGQLLNDNEIPILSTIIGNETLKNTGLLNLNIQQPYDITNENKETILLVEDNPSLQQFIHSILEPCYDVVITSNGIEALEWLEKNHLTYPNIEESPINKQLILSDVMMPEMDGFTLLEKVKSDDRFCSIPFILLTARADINDKLRGLRIGVDDYMTKPFEVEELLLRIKNLLQNAKNRSISEELLNTEVSEQEETIGTNVSQESKAEALPTVDLDWLKEVETIALRELRNKSFTTDQLADELFISKSKLFRKIKRITGLTPMKYMKLLRLQKAKRILETEDVLTLTEICYAVGLENTTHFAKSYQKEFGKRPHELLKNKII